MSVLKQIKRSMVVPYNFHESIPYFMVMRPSNSKFGGKSYQFCKGRIDGNESSLEAAYREVQEELGVDLDHLSEFVLIGNTMNDTCHLYITETKRIDFLQTRLNGETAHIAWLCNDEFQLIGRDWQRRTCSRIHDFLMNSYRHE